MIKKIIPIALLSALALGGTALAKEVSISTVADANPGQKCSLRVYNQNVDPVNATFDEIVCFEEAQVDDESKITFKFDFNNTSGYYAYVIKSFAGDWSYTGKIAFINDDEYNAALSELEAAVNSATPAQSLKTVLDKYEGVFLLSDGFEIDAKLNALNTSNAYQKMATQIKQMLAAGSLTNDKLAEVYKNELLLCGIEKGNNALIVEINDNYNNVIGLDVEVVNGYYNDFTGSIKEQCAKIEQGTYNTLADYKKAHSEAVAITAINNSSSWLNMGKVIDALNEVADLQFPSLSENDRGKVLSALASKKPFASKADFIAATKSAVSNLDNKTHATSSTGGGGGGGGGGGTSFGGTSAPAPQDKLTSLAKWLVEPFTLKDETSVLNTIKNLIKEIQ